MQGNIQHLAERYMERCEAIDDRIMACFRGLAAKMKKRTMPNGPWYRPVREGKQIKAYIVGQGNYVSSILTDKMYAKGTLV
jgi:hypothetical protein